MQPLDPQSEFRALLALVDAVRASVLSEMDVLARNPGVTPLLRSCLTRARGHLELAHRALHESRPERSFAAPRGLANVGIEPATLGTPLRLDAGLQGFTGPRIATPAPIGSAPPSAPNQVAATERRAAGRHVFRPDGNEGAPSWVQSRVEEIGRALDSALGGGFEDPHSGAGDVLVMGAACPAPQAPPHFSGSTDILSIPDLVGFFQVQAKTGVLEIEHPSENFRLEFEGGALLHAASTNSPRGERLGEILVRRGALTEARLTAFLKNLSKGERLGAALLRDEGIGESELTAAVEEQVLGIFVRLARLPGCRFTFRECTLDTDMTGRVRHNVTRLLLDSARHLDEAASHEAASAQKGPTQSGVSSATDVGRQSA
jgi:hypothetical protein